MPLETLGVNVPAPGEKWTGNLARERFVQQSATAKGDMVQGEPEIYRWSVSLDTTALETPETFGGLIFE